MPALRGLHSVDGRFKMLEMVKILRQLVKAEVRWNAIHAQGFAFVRTQPSRILARIFLVSQAHSSARVGRQIGKAPGCSLSRC